MTTQKQRDALARDGSLEGTIIVFDGVVVYTRTKWEAKKKKRQRAEPAPAQVPAEPESSGDDDANDGE